MAWSQLTNTPILPKVTSDLQGEFSAQLGTGRSSILSLPCRAAKYLNHTVLGFFVTTATNWLRASRCDGALQNGWHLWTSGTAVKGTLTQRCKKFSGRLIRAV